MSSFEQKQQVLTTDHAVPYDYLVLATGTSSNYFGHDAWRRGIYQVRTSVSPTAVTVKLREATLGCSTTQAPNKERLFILRMESRGLSRPTICME